MSDIPASELFKEVLCASLLDRLERGECLHLTYEHNYGVWADVNHRIDNRWWTETVYSFSDVAGLELFQLTFFKQPRTGENIVSIIAIDNGLYRNRQQGFEESYALADDNIPIFTPCYSGQYKSGSFRSALVLKVPPSIQSNKAERKKWVNMLHDAPGEEWKRFMSAVWFDSFAFVYENKQKPITTVKTDLDVLPPVDKDTVRAFLAEFRDVHFDRILSPTAPLDAILQSRGRTKTFIMLDGAEATVPMAAVQLCFAKDPEALPRLLNFDDDLGEYGGVLSLIDPSSDEVQVLCGLHAGTPKADLFRALEHDDTKPILLSLAEEPDVHARNDVWFSWLDTVDVKPVPPPPPPPPRAAFCDA